MYQIAISFFDVFFDNHLELAIRSFKTDHELYSTWRTVERTVEPSGIYAEVRVDGTLEVDREVSPEFVRQWTGRPLTDLIAEARQRVAAEDQALLAA